MVWLLLLLQTPIQTPLPRSPGSPTLNLTPVPSPQPQPPALFRAPTLDLTLSPLPEVLDWKKQDEEGEDSDVERDFDSKSDSDSSEEEEKSKEEEKSRDWADLVEEEVTNEAKLFRSDIMEAIREEFKKGTGKVQDREKRRDFVRGLRLWQDFKPRRVRAMCAWVGEEETDLSLEPGAVVTGVRPAAWLNDGLLEGALDGKIGLFLLKDVEYLEE
jgi:hypothetical protein